MPLKPIILKGEQKRVLFLQVTDPIQIKGVAGSGKTTVALYRAKHLLETQSNLFQESKIAIFTYNTTLSAYIEAIKAHISGGYQKDSEEIIPKSPKGLNVQVINFDKYAYRFLSGRGMSVFINLNELNVWKHSTVVNAINVVLKQYPQSKTLKKNVGFFIDEISWIKGKLFKTEDEYIQSRRTGRGTAGLTETAKKRIWAVYELYRREAEKAGKIDFDDYPSLIIQSIEADSSFTPPFTHIIIDEAQDLSKAQILALSKLVSEQTRSISIIADAAQKIYKKGFTWTEVGIEVRGGRTLSLKKNYRNTEAILLAANSLLDHEPDKSEFTEAEAARKGGAKPTWAHFSSWAEEGAYLLGELRKRHSEDALTVVLHRDWNGMRKISDTLTANGIGNEIIKGNSILDFTNQLVKICTLSSVKGLEFDNVFIVDVNDDIIPYPSNFDEEDGDLHISTERRLLYTAMTRAREYLYMLSAGTPSRYLSEIDPNLLQTAGSVNNISKDQLPF